MRFRDICFVDKGTCRSALGVTFPEPPKLVGIVEGRSRETLPGYNAL
jgi:hypothetical protein